MKRRIKGNIEFKEIQQMRQKWLWALIISCILFAIGLVIILDIIDEQPGNEGLISLVIVVPLNALILYLMYITKFETYVTGEAVYYRWHPFFKKFNIITKEEIESVHVKKSPLLHYGYKRMPGNVRVHNLANGKGLQFVLKSGRKIFIGSQKISGFQRAVDKLIPMSTQ